MLRKKTLFSIYLSSCVIIRKYWWARIFSFQAFLDFTINVRGFNMCRIFFSTTMSYNGTCNSCSSGQYQNWRQILINITEQLTPYESAVEEVSFEWQHLRISSTDSKVRNYSHVSLVDFRSKKVKHSAFSTDINTRPNSSTPQCVPLHQK